jgi:hypothetical protein
MKTTSPKIRFAGGPARNPDILFEIHEGSEWHCCTFDFIKHFDIIKPYLEHIAGLVEEAEEGAV